MRASTGQFHRFEVVQSREFGAAHSHVCACANKSLHFVDVNAQINSENTIELGLPCK